MSDDEDQISENVKISLIGNSGVGKTCIILRYTNESFNENSISTQGANYSPKTIKAQVTASLISEGCEIYGRVENSVLFSGVTVEENALVKDSVVMANTKISPGAEVNKSIIDENCLIGPGARVGDSQTLTVLGINVEVTEQARVEAGAWVAPNSLIEKGGE